ncbi:hypothetical protein SAMN04489751_2796 [Brevibacterium sandarakinum]|uniref:Uncharacterized protein n=1 Tax=Brevibacterium sandarakinum TaxID=629680 RepID=A0A1H1UUJ1_BRESA|nr:hypothetical protein SAMN04489751_2796 [Brevibacterium sandarakinum]
MTADWKSLHHSVGFATALNAEILRFDPDETRRCLMHDRGLTRARTGGR